MPAMPPGSDDRILDTYAEGILGKYTAEFADGISAGDGRELADALQRVREQLHSTQSSAAVCLICLETMHNDDAVWHCSRGCCCVLHLLCIQAWSRQQVAAAAYSASQESAREESIDKAQASWGCPKCRTAYQPSEVPSEYRCFCGKQRDPPLDPWLAPHTCGDICGRELASGCGHTCVLLCHPGPCPPCPRQIVLPCHCEKVSKPVRCSKANFSCGRLCGKRLPCAVEAAPWRVSGSAPVGRLSTATWHVMRRLQFVVPRVTSCCLVGDTDVLSGAIMGPAPSTAEQWWTRPVSVARPTRCEKKCSSMKACGRHQCRRRCCDGDCPPCDLPCGRRLRCGNHKCPAPCHSGPCLPCPLTSAVVCACGQTRYTLPCGSEGKAVPPQCRELCPIPGTCRHADARPSHRCHWGACPPCSQFCGTPHPCGHACASPSCHDRLPPAIPAFAQPLPPASATFTATKPVQHDSIDADSLSPAYQAAEAVKESQEGFLLECPPCQAPVPTACLGGHTNRPLPCCTAAPFCCGTTCGQPLTCGNHTCSNACHAVLSAPGSQQGCDADASAEACEQCTRACQRERSCGHACALPCHPDPCPPCQMELQQACHCGRSLVPVICHQLQEASEADKGQLLCCGKPCHKALPMCPHVCQAICHQGPCPAASAEGCQEEVAVRCSCRRRKAKMSCYQVQQKLRAVASSEAYTDATPLRLLPCDQGCKSAKVSRQEAELSERAVRSATSAAVHAEQRESISAPAAMAIAETHKGPRRRNRAERAALQQEQDLLEQQQARRKQWWTIVRRTVQAVCVVALACAVFVFFYSTLHRTRQCCKSQDLHGVCQQSHGIPAVRRHDLWDLINISRPAEKAQECEAQQYCAVCGDTEMASQVQGLLRHNHGRPYMCMPCSNLKVIARGPCPAFGMAGGPSAPGMFGRQQHGASLCTGCRYKKRYQEWTCIACGAIGTGAQCGHAPGTSTISSQMLCRACRDVLEHQDDPQDPPQNMRWDSEQDISQTSQQTATESKSWYSSHSLPRQQQTRAEDTAVAWPRSQLAQHGMDPNKAYPQMDQSNGKNMTCLGGCQTPQKRQRIGPQDSPVESNREATEVCGAAAMPAGSGTTPHTASASGHHSEARDQTAALSHGDLTAPERTNEGEQSCGVVTAGPILIDGMALEATLNVHQSQAMNLVHYLRPLSRSAVMVTAGPSGAAASCIQPEPRSPLLLLSCTAQAPTAARWPLSQGTALERLRSGLLDGSQPLLSQHSHQAIQQGPCLMPCFDDRALGSPARQVAALQAAPFCLPFLKASGL
ncbi:hypothetical protein WJX77_009558 [Trebouxia sp. C0004]